MLENRIKKKKTGICKNQRASALGQEPNNGRGKNEAREQARKRGREQGNSIGKDERAEKNNGELGRIDLGNCTFCNGHF